jgi:hypothetical protein
MLALSLLAAAAPAVTAQQAPGPKDLPAYHDGLKYPHLVRIEGTPDRLAAIFQPLK